MSGVGVPSCAGVLNFPYEGELPDGARISFGVTTREFSEYLRDTRDLDAGPVRERLRRSLGGGSARIAYLHQAHSGRVLAVSSGDGPRRVDIVQKGGDICVEGADGLVTAEEDLTLVVLSADCLSLHLVVPSHPSFIAMVHAGWRGSQAGVARAAVQLLRELSGLDPLFYFVFLGPAIRACCYEVAEDFLGRFERSAFRRGGSVFMDLVEENKRQLLEEGVDARKISDCGFCTSCRIDKFFSNRREGHQAGRMISWIVKKS